MRARVLAAWEYLAGPPAPPELQRALTAALSLRHSLDEHHPWALHPARTALILMDDCGETDPALLAAAVGVDSLVPEWHTAPLVPVPATAGERLLEELVTAPRGIRLTACAEHLDHARHLHMLAIAGEDEFRGRVADVYLPVALRTDAQLARRFARWLEASRRRRPDAP